MKKIFILLYWVWFEMLNVYSVFVMLVMKFVDEFKIKMSYVRKFELIYKCSSENDIYV